MHTGHIPRKLRFLPTLLLLPILISCGDRAVQQGNALLETGDFLAARAVFEKIVRRRPMRFDAHFGLGMTFCAEAIYKTDLGLAKPEDWYPAIYSMTVAMHLSDNREVRQTLGILHFNLGACYKDAGNKDAAIERLEQAVSYDSTLVKAFNVLGALYHERGDWDLARRCYRAAVALEPDYSLAHFNLGVLAWAYGDYEAALESFARAASIEPDNPVFSEWRDKARKRAGG